MKRRWFLRLSALTLLVVVVALFGTQRWIRPHLFEPIELRYATYSFYTDEPPNRIATDHGWMLSNRTLDGGGHVLSPAGELSDVRAAELCGVPPSRLDGADAKRLLDDCGRRLGLVDVAEMPTPIVEDVIEPLIGDTADTLVDDVVQPLIDEVVDVVDHTVGVVEGTAEAVDDTVGPLVDETVQPLVDETVEPLVDDLTDPLDDIVPALGGLLGPRRFHTGEPRKRDQRRQPGNSPQAPAHRPRKNGLRFEKSTGIRARTSSRTSSSISW